MHIRTTTALLALFAASGLATPIQHSELQLDQQAYAQGQLPFLAQGQPSSSVSSGKLLTVEDTGVQSFPSLPSLESFKAILPPVEYAKLVEHIDALPEQRIIALSERPEDRYTVTEGQKALLSFHGVKFIDITDAVLSGLDSQESVTASRTADVDYDDDDAASAFPSNWTYGRNKLQKKYYDNIDTKRMKSFLLSFSAFRTRYYRSSEGRQSQLFLLEKIHEIVSDKKNDHLKMTVEEFPHSWGQNSIIVKMPVANHTGSAKGTIVVGAHQDSTNLLPFLSAPGADDDGSGTTTVMEVLHILTQAGYVPQSHNVEFHFYSAEEGGMLGSQAIVNDYQKRVKNARRGEHVKAMLQMDMTAYVKPGTQERIGIIQDFVSPSLTEFVHRLIDEYNDIPSVQTACKYACSDHSSWTKIGVPSAFAIEATFEDSNTRHIHTSGDTIEVEGFSFDHMAQFVQLATAFVLELSA